MFENFNSGMKCGLLIMMFSGLLMLVLLLLEKPVFDLIIWLFLGGMMITLVSSIILRRNFFQKNRTL